MTADSLSYFIDAHVLLSTSWREALLEYDIDFIACYR